MKKSGILNSQLSRLIAAMGHCDKLAICDCGLPIPHEREVVDLALTKNIPRFIETVKAILAELHVEQAIIAAEMESRSAGIHRELLTLLSGIEIVKIPHDEFKKITNGEGNIAFVRTGEASPYANVILVSGVTFG